jgi:hypothetical protein
VEPPLPRGFSPNGLSAACSAIPPDFKEVSFSNDVMKQQCVGCFAPVSPFKKNCNNVLPVEIQQVYPFIYKVSSPQILTCNASLIKERKK